MVIPSLDFLARFLETTGGVEKATISTTIFSRRFISFSIILASIAIDPPKECPTN